MLGNPIPKVFPLEDLVESRRSSSRSCDMHCCIQRCLVVQQMPTCKNTLFRRFDVVKGGQTNVCFYVF